MARLSDAELLERYEDWDQSTSAVEFAESMGVTKTYLYQTLRKHNVVPKSMRASINVDVDVLEQILQRLDSIEEQLNVLSQPLGTSRKGLETAAARAKAS